MPTFPTYNGELPACLSPTNPRHYLLLIYWIYFRPTAFKCYLYQADPELYRAEWGLGIFRTWRVPAYRNLYLMIAPTVLFLSVLVGLPIVLTASWIQGTPVEWLGWFVGVVIRGAFGLVIGVAFGVTMGVAIGVAGGMGLGVAGGITLGVAFGIVGGMAEGAVFNIVFSVALSIGFGMVFGMVFSMTFSVVWMVALGVVVGIITGFRVSVPQAMARLMTRAVVAGVVPDMAEGVAFAILLGVLGSVLFGIIFSVGSLRIPFYPVQFVLALRRINQRLRHPLAWDELLVLPLPRTRQLLISQLQEDENQGLRLLANVARNPFQRWAAQSTLQIYLHNQAPPLHFLYTILTEPTLNEYVFAPAQLKDWKELPSTKELLLGELAGQWVDSTTDFINRLPEFLVWTLTWYLRDRRQTSLTNFAGVLYELLDRDRIEAQAFDLSSYREVYSTLTEYPGGDEIAYSFEALAKCLTYDRLLALPAAMAFVSEFAPHEGAIRPTVLAAFVRLGQVGAEVAAYRDATSRVRQQGALLRATDMLDELDEYVVAEVMAPEEAILRRIIRQWRRLVSEEGGVVGRVEELAPVANPYVVGNPVTGMLFVGREDIMRRLEELWAAEGQRPSVVIYGHRRMGKSSILHNLGARFGGGTTVVDFNMQRVGYVADTGELLVALAFALYDSLPLAQQKELGEPDEERFLERNPYTTFDRFVKQLERVREGQRFIITIDEFELLEEAISEGRLEARLIDFWRGIIQSYAWFVMAFAGLHTLQEMTHSYWHPLFGSVTTIPVTFLRPPAARKLITQPTLDFSLDYDHDAIERIISLTNGQPYLIQLICHGLVTRFNRQTFEQAIKRQPRFTLTDVEAIINAPDFFRDGNAYFTGVWRQAKTGNIPSQPTILKALALSESPLTPDIIAQEARLPYHETKIALAELQAHDMVKQQEEGWQLSVELMRRWVRRNW